MSQKVYPVKKPQTNTPQQGAEPKKPRPLNGVPMVERGTLRQEIDQLTQHITKTIQKDPKKAAKVFSQWLNEPRKSTKKIA